MHMYSSVADVLEKVWDAAVEFGNFEHCPEINAVGFFGNTPLHIAITWGDFEAVKLLVENGANINASGERGETPLHDAISMTEFQIARYLNKSGSQSKCKEFRG